MRLARVFPRRTKASPDDAFAFFGPPPFDIEADEVHIDVTFTADKLRAEWLADQWQHVAPVKIGGVAYETEENIYPPEFTPGLYIKAGYTFTSRGCPRRCWFCGVWIAGPQPIVTLLDALPPDPDEDPDWDELTARVASVSPSVSFLEFVERMLDRMDA